MSHVTVTNETRQRSHFLSEGYQEERTGILRTSMSGAQMQGLLVTLDNERRVF